jgi:ERCC4-type nuclease
MLIKVDNRDSNLYDKCLAIIESNKEKYGSISVEKETLPLGDVILYDNSNITDLVEKIIIERKSLPDLAASIRDGRYSEQSFRLQQCSMHNHNIFYVIEGDLRYYKPFKGNIDKKSLLSAMVSLSYHKGFSVHRTMNLDETAECIIQIAYKIKKESTLKAYYEPIPILNNTDCNINNPNNTNTNNIQEDNTNITNNETYSEVCNRVKKNNVTKENIGEIMLMQIPNVSTASAISIMEKYKTIGNLIKEMEQNQDALNGITIKTKNNTSRKISKTTIANIYYFLLPNSNSINIDI